MKKGGSLMIDMVFSMTVLFVLILMATVSIKNIFILDRRNDIKKELIEIASEESEREKIRIENSQKLLEENEKIIRDDTEIEINRKIIDEKFGSVKTEIVTKKKGCVQRLEVYSISNSEKRNGNFE